jgi:hypothetical protein
MTEPGALALIATIIASSVLSGFTLGVLMGAFFIHWSKPIPVDGPDPGERKAA